MLGWSKSSFQASCVPHFGFVGSDLDFHWIYEPNIDRYVTTPSRVRRRKPIFVPSIKRNVDKVPSTEMMPRLTLSDRDGALKPRNDSREDHDYTVDGQAIPRCSSPETESAPEVVCALYNAASSVSDTCSVLHRFCRGLTAILGIWKHDHDTGECCSVGNLGIRSQRVFLLLGRLC